MPKRARISLPWYSWIFIETLALRWPDSTRRPGRARPKRRREM
jgi:hypothetical protein